MASLVLLLLCAASVSNGHIVAFTQGMYCQNGVSGDNQNAADAVNPLFMLKKDQWWMQHYSNCDERPPSKNDFLEIPAGGSFTVELATNQAFTTLSYDGRMVGTFADGQEHPEYSQYHNTCITSPNLHTQNQSMAAGTAFAISYESDLRNVTPENLVVFSVLEKTPWHRIAIYDAPKALPACPPGGCTCTWGWIPNGCGEPNMYMLPYKCKVTGATSTIPVAKGKPPVWCEDDRSKCVSGPKQMLYWHQAEGNNIEVSGYDLSGSPKSPGYNTKCGFSSGAQNDIFGRGHRGVFKKDD
ncbi:uncharacterized protein ARMOST_03010 [Armillaria ostoyae]|uniref:Uncharacterized protein n=1 Tax=Armillaria ostoyae TaxID=47428 RepID=A0A284QTD1_ARMOS|nr:uncharacterized protein ARMOST_03010 [Armillaria ostoyae]